MKASSSRTSPSSGRGRVTEPKAILEGVMNRHAVKQPAAIAGSPPGDPGAPSSRRLREAPREGSAGPGASAVAGTPAARILEELDVGSGNLIADPPRGACSAG
jgi:hypothetical protein